jgi:aspartate beta-hydroxylase
MLASDYLMASSEHSSTPAGAENELQAARQHVQAGRSADAEQSYRRVIEILPDSIEALVFLGNAAQARDDGATAVKLLSRASKADPANVDILMYLGAVYRAAERFDAARYVLERAVRLAGGSNAYVRLSLASVLELDERPELALLHYCQALIEAQRLGRWTSHDDKMAALKAQIEHARQYAGAGRRHWFERVLQGAGYGVASERSTRIDAALGSYLGARLPKLSDPQQRAGLMHVPGVATARFIDNARFDWLDGLPDAIAPCIGEMELCVASSASAGQIAAGTGTLCVPVFSAGVLQYEARRLAPRLLSALRGLPLANVQHHAPDVNIIALHAGARIARHHGRANAFCWVIVNPVGSAAIQVRVGGENRVLQPASALAADPSFGVEYLNVGNAPALSLVLEAWHPDLNDSEQRAISGLITAVIDFDKHMQELD